MQFESVNKIIERSIRDYWELPSISNYKGATLCYKDVARKMEKLHILFEECGVQKGDRIAISSRNQANWAVSFFATLTYGADLVRAGHLPHVQAVRGVFRHRRGHGGGGLRHDSPPRLRHLRRHRRAAGGRRRGLLHRARPGTPVAAVPAADGPVRPGAENRGMAHRHRHSDRVRGQVPAVRLAHRRRQVDPRCDKGA